MRSLLTGQIRLTVSLGICVCLLWTAAVAGKSPDSRKQQSDRYKKNSNRGSDKENPELVREGTRLIDKIGSFEPVNSVILFKTADEKYTFEGLPNANLQRVQQALTADNLECSVTGVVTEYQGANYILIEKFTLKAKSNPNSLRHGGSRKQARTTPSR